MRNPLGEPNAPRTTLRDTSECECCDSANPIWWDNFRLCLTCVVKYEYGYWRSALLEVKRNYV